MRVQRPPSYWAVLVGVLLVSLLAARLGLWQLRSVEESPHRVERALRARLGAATGVRLAPTSALPAQMQAAPEVVRIAYRFALANREVLRQVPCHCGCGAMGHDSNAACYLTGASAEGAPVFDTHALGCSICVDITQDVMRLMGQGKQVAETRAYVESTYGRYGPSNLP